MDSEGINVEIRNKDNAAVNWAYTNPNIQGIPFLSPQPFDQKEDELMITQFDEKLSNLSMGSINRNENKREIEMPKFDPNDLFNTVNNQREETLFRH